MEGQQVQAAEESEDSKPMERFVSLIKAEKDEPISSGEM
jgi:hypothetical protein